MKTKVKIKNERTQRKGNPNSIFVPIEVAKELIKPFNIKTVTQYRELSKNLKLPEGIPSKPFNSYKNKGWINWSDYLGCEIVSPQDKKFYTYEESIPVIRSYGFKSSMELRKYGPIKGIPSQPNKEYEGKGWVNYNEWLGINNLATQELSKLYVSYDEAENWAIQQNLNSSSEFRKLKKENKLPLHIPSRPHESYKDKGWVSWGKFLGTNRIADHLREYMPYNELEKLVQTKGFEKREEYYLWWENEKPNNVPKTPDNCLTYKNDWISWGKFLGTGLTNMEKSKLWVSYEECSKFAISNNIKSQREWFEFVENNEIPSNIPIGPAKVYENSGWSCWADFLGQIGNGNHKMTKQAMVSILKSIKPELNKFNNLILYKMLVHCKAHIWLKKNGLFDVLVNGGTGIDNREETIDKAINSLEKTTEEEFDSEQEIGEISDIPPTEDEIKQIIEKEDETIAESDEDRTSLPRVNPIESLEIYDNPIVRKMIKDDETLDFIKKFHINEIFNSIMEGLTNPKDLIQTINPSKFSEIVINDVLDELIECNNLVLRDDYIKKDDNGNFVDLFLMQRLVTIRFFKRLFLGNWSGTGTGKTIASLYAARHAECRNVVIICLNSNVKTWKKEIKETFKNNNIFIKSDFRSKFDINLPNKGYNYLILNVETFQQSYIDEFLENLLKNNTLDCLIIDEVQSVKTSDESNESIRTQSVLKLVEHCKNKNENFKMMIMSATPIINNFIEPKNLIEMLTGLSHDDIDTSINIQNGLFLYELLTRYGVRFKTKKKTKVIKPKCEIYLNDVNVDDWKVGLNDYLGMEQYLLPYKFSLIKPFIKKGKTIIYIQYVTGIKKEIRNFLKSINLTCGFFTGDDKSGLDKFLNGEVDVLVGSYSMSTGIDGLQKKADTIIYLIQPWTSADKQQIDGRIVDRTGIIFSEVTIVTPLVYITNGDEVIDYDFRRMERINQKGTYMDLVLDGIIPKGKLPPRQKLLTDVKNLIDGWINKVENDDYDVIERKKLNVPLDFDIKERLFPKYGDFSLINQEWSTRNSKTTHEKLKQNPEEFYYYHDLYAEARKSWGDDIPYLVIADKIKRIDYVVADLGCGMNLLSKEINNQVYAFDHHSVEEGVIECDISDLSDELENESIDISVLSLSLMGSNSKTDYIKEANRITKINGILHVAEPRNKWTNKETGQVGEELKVLLESNGFKCYDMKLTEKFVYFDCIKL
jgi:hypothetical protein